MVEMLVSKRFILDQRKHKIVFLGCPHGLGEKIVKGYILLFRLVITYLYFYIAKEAAAPLAWKVDPMAVFAVTQ